MTAKTPIRTVFTGAVATGLAEFQTGEFVPLANGGLGASLSIGSANQVLKVNSGGTAVEFGTVPVADIDSATDLTGITIVGTDSLLLSDNGTEGRVTASQIATYVQSATDTDNISEGSTNLYYTSARANTDFDTRLGTKTTTNLTEGDNLYYTNARADARVALATGTNLDLTNQDTDDLSEGSTNLYYTDARANSAFDTRLGTKDTDNLTEGSTNLYYTSARANTDFDTRLGTKTTTNLTEGDNLYYTDARANSAFDTRLGTKDTDDLSEGSTNLYYTNARADARVAAATGVNLDLSNQDTGDLAEGSNLYYTDARSRAAISVTDSGGDGSLSYNNSTGVVTYTGPSASEVRAHFSGGTGVTITSGEIAIGQAVATNSDVQFNDLVVDGNLTVNGTTVTNSATNTTIEDALIELGSGNTGANSNDLGLILERGTTGDNGFIGFDESADKFIVGTTTATGSSTGGLTITTGTLVANIEGNVTGNVTGTVSDVSNHDTDDISEGSTNLYYTDARANSAFDTRLATKTTTNLTEGDNLYYTDARVNSAFDTRLGTKDTDDLSEGSTNLYYTDARSRAAISVTDSGGDGSLSYNSSTGVVTYTGPSASEVRAHFSAGTGVSITNGEVAIGQAVATNSNVQFNNVQIDGTLDCGVLT